MIVPGSNLLALAATVIGFQTATHHRNKGLDATNNGTNDGIVLPQYYAPAPIRGSIQAVPRTAYEANGLDLAKEYVMFYTPVRLQDTRRDKAPDLIDYGADQYTVESNTDWQNQDGWSASICVKNRRAPP